MPTITSLAWSCRQCPPLRSVLLASTSNTRELAEAVVVLVEQREVVLVGIVVDEALHRADAERTVAQHRVRHDVPAERVGQLVRRDLALAERALREVPERALAAARLVDRRHLHAVDRRLDEERRVRRLAHAADELELGRRRARSRELVGRQFQRGQRCPAGSIGKSQSGHGGRPPATASAPRAAIARTWARVA